jgi:hypothetical protein
MRHRALGMVLAAMAMAMANAEAVAGTISLGHHLPFDLTAPVPPVEGEDLAADPRNGAPTDVVPSLAVRTPGDLLLVPIGGGLFEFDSYTHAPRPVTRPLVDLDALLLSSLTAVTAGVPLQEAMAGVGPETLLAAGPRSMDEPVHASGFSLALSPINVVLFGAGLGGYLVARRRGRRRVRRRRRSPARVA